MGEGKGGTNWESSIDIYTLECVELPASGKADQHKISSVLCDDLERWWGEGGEGGSRGRRYMYT